MEHTVTKAKNKKAKTEKNILPPPSAWIPMRNGMIIVGMASLGMAILTAWEVIPVRGWLEGILWGLLFGALIWVIFFGMYWFNRLIRR